MNSAVFLGNLVMPCDLDKISTTYKEIEQKTKKGECIILPFPIDARRTIIRKESEPRFELLTRRTVNGTELSNFKNLIVSSACISTQTSNPYNYMASVPPAVPTPLFDLLRFLLSIVCFFGLRPRFLFLSFFLAGSSDLGEFRGLPL